MVRSADSADSDLTSAEAKKIAPWMVIGSIAIVVFQCATSIAVMMGSFRKSCSSSDQCPPNTYCLVGYNQRVRPSFKIMAVMQDSALANSFRHLLHQCDYCGSFRLHLLINGTLIDGEDEEYWPEKKQLVLQVCDDPTTAPSRGEDMRPLGIPQIQSWCETCVHAIDGAVDTTGVGDKIEETISAMGELCVPHCFIDFFAPSSTARLTSMCVICATRSQSHFIDAGCNAQGLTCICLRDVHRFSASSKRVSHDDGRLSL